MGNGTTRRALRGAHRSRAGLSLVEMLVAMALLGVLAALAVPVFQGARERSKTASCDQAFGALDGEIANELELLTLDGANEPSCGDMGTPFPDLQVIRCVTSVHREPTNPRDETQRLYFNYVETPFPYDSCQIGLDESSDPTGLGILLRQFAAPDTPERTVTISLQ